KPAEASIVTGYSPSRISILQADPAFEELLAFYRANTDAAFAELQDRMATLSLDMVEELRERLESNPESFSNTLLLEGLKSLADRTGHGPTTKSITASFNFDPARLANARKRLALEDQRTVPETCAPQLPPEESVAGDGNSSQGE